MTDPSDRSNRTEALRYETVLSSLRDKPARWLITGVAGFIGSHLLEHLLEAGQAVVGIDNFSTGSRRNLEAVFRLNPTSNDRFTFLEGDIRDLDLCRQAVVKVDYVLHQAALGSVPRSLKDPIATNDSNVDGTLRVLIAARDAGVKRFVYAGSSSTYGDEPNLPKIESRIGKPLSPYAVTKFVTELYADIFHRSYGLPVIGLRYFNVFGPRQDPAGPYAAVIPRWISALMDGEPCVINGDGETSRDFCYVANVVEANILAALAGSESVGQVYNVACGDRTNLNELFEVIRTLLIELGEKPLQSAPEYRPFRAGDVRHSEASIDKIRAMLSYEPLFRVRQGLRETVKWYVANRRAAVGT